MSDMPKRLIEQDNKESKRIKLSALEALGNSDSENEENEPIVIESDSDDDIIEGKCTVIYSCLVMDPN